ncbi:MAG: redox-regulated ATPase YchF [Dehalococcoidia bacterium]|nr:redox-regulated ATPase YchF [Dehalococcoidia bacterium]
MDIALIGLAASGKTTLLHALAAGHLPGGHTSPTETAMAVVKVPDERLDRLAAAVSARKTTYLELRLMDFPGFSVGRKGPPPQLLGTLSTADLLVHVVRSFSEESIPHPLESIDPDRDIAALELELIFADLAVVERRTERIQVEARSLAAGARGPLDRELALQRRLKEALEAEKPVRSLGLTAEEKTLLSGFNLLTGKPLLNVLNIDEADAPRTAEIEAAAREKHAGPDADVIAIAAKAEADVAELPADEAAEFRRELGLPEQAAAERLLQETVSLLGLITFYTVGPQDTHAWSVSAGTPAVKAAGRIHSDIERGFIRAEVIDSADFLEAGSHAEAKRRGNQRLEGKTYEVREGDVINVLFNV